MNQRDEEILACTCGHYPWDDWQRCALTRGVNNELATLGRAVMREAYQHDWEARLQALCGWNDNGEAMIELALSGPDQALFAWQKLLDTDGCRGSRNEKTGAWVSWL